ncbi:MAG TPA: GNAT family N-acetyltransferase [Bacteroidales bacterium]|nr:GNAT family N-acetyltransferase [Bacteroidales bacterium]HSA42509.1 GNAT family N-acetyltransferase [Bacteroidales bacterium]
MNEIKIFNETNRPGPEEKREIIAFLFKHLENFGDLKTDIEKAVNYALKETVSFGGFILQAFEGDTMACVLVVNQTGMKGYIPENILVYIATHNEFRGKGIGKRMILKAIEIADGNMALHVEHDNPARSLYEKVGFTSKYLEMRYIKK